NNEDIIAWILSQFPSKSSIFDALQEILPFVSVATARLCLKSGRDLSEEKAITTNCLDNKRAAIRLRCFDKKYSLEFEAFFSIQLDIGNVFSSSVLFSKIPMEYSWAKIGDKKTKRGACEYYKVSDPGQVV
ncbi:hypothetical protein PFISCL1PPCAC_25517, partial [Pristionchus fissidentatus]